MHYHVSMTILESGYYYYSNFTTQRSEMLGAKYKEVKLEFDCLEEHMFLTVSYISIMVSTLSGLHQIMDLCFSKRTTDQQDWHHLVIS